MYGTALGAFGSGNAIRSNYVDKAGDAWDIPGDYVN